MQDKHVIDELRRLETEHGVLRPSDVVEAARSTSSPLHNQFEWDDTRAAERYRIEQARALIRVCVEYVGARKLKRPVFVSLSSDRAAAGGGYRSLTHVLAMDNLKAQLLDDALLDMERFTSRYATISELADVRESMGRAARRIKGGGKAQRKSA